MNNSIQKTLSANPGNNDEISEIGKDPKWNELKSAYRAANSDPDFMNSAERETLKKVLREGRLPQQTLNALCRNIKELKRSLDASRGDG